MKKFFLFILVAFTLLQWSIFAEATSLNEAYKNKQSNVQVQGSGSVIRLLKDDNKGGVIHWTHKDPKGYHIGGWLKHNGNVYQ